jgi:hypothetical protein
MEAMALIVDNEVSEKPKFNRVHNWAQIWDKCDQSTTSQPIYLTYILILLSHLRLRLPGGFCSSGFPTKIFYAFLTFPMCVICPVHFIPLIWGPENIY